MGVHHESARLLQDPSSSGFGGKGASINMPREGERKSNGAGFWGSVFNLANAVR
jgi:hypothetical protein